MKLIIEAEPKEIATLVLALQGQRDESQNQDKEAIADAIRDILLEGASSSDIHP
ncbi:MAG: hypothetical protein HFE45_03815 [Oscillospiraceae bacterium]|jgi:hypothetical protein|nr:hypothetical protein [Oscillospiraceae bacterium]